MSFITDEKQVPVESQQIGDAGCRSSQKKCFLRRLLDPNLFEYIQVYLCLGKLLHN
ncbi:MAG: hypothetical protein ACTSRW_15435 [Candidatus Helarchaeota archaeon]